MFLGWLHLLGQWWVVDVTEPQWQVLSNKTFLIEIKAPLYAIYTSLACCPCQTKKKVSVRMVSSKNVCMEKNYSLSSFPRFDLFDIAFLFLRFFWISRVWNYFGQVPSVFHFHLLSGLVIYGKTNFHFVAYSLFCLSILLRQHIYSLGTLSLPTLWVIIL